MYRSSFLAFVVIFISPQAPAEIFDCIGTATSETPEKQSELPVYLSIEVDSESQQYRIGEGPNANSADIRRGEAEWERIRSATAKKIQLKENHFNNPGGSFWSVDVKTLDLIPSGARFYDQHSFGTNSSGDKHHMTTADCRIRDEKAALASCPEVVVVPVWKDKSEDFWQYESAKGADRGWAKLNTEEKLSQYIYGHYCENRYRDDVRAGRIRNVKQIGGRSASCKTHSDGSFSFRYTANCEVKGRCSFQRAEQKEMCSTHPGAQQYSR